jgi:hypothetical protein
MRGQSIARLPVTQRIPGTGDTRPRVVGVIPPPRPVVMRVWFTVGIEGQEAIPHEAPDNAGGPESSSLTLLCRYRMNVTPTPRSCCGTACILRWSAKGWTIQRLVSRARFTATLARYAGRGGTADWPGVRCCNSQERTEKKCWQNVCGMQMMHWNYATSNRQTADFEYPSHTEGWVSGSNHRS